MTALLPAVLVCAFEFLAIIWLCSKLIDARLTREEYADLQDKRDKISVLEAENQGLRSFIDELERRAA